ncbi:MAG: C25 family cysteine peptidase, partial [Candidatus Hodarchaeota archaeon]
MKIQMKRSFLKKSFAIIFGLIFICQIFIPFSNLSNSNLNLEDFGFGYNPSSDANSNFENIEFDDEITQEWENEHNFDYPENSDVRLLNFNKKMMNLEVSISRLENENITAPTGDIYQRLSIERGGYLGEVGCPKLPFKNVKILIPYGKDMKDIEIIMENKQILEGTYKIEPAQAPVPVDSTEIPEFTLNEFVYNSKDTFPDEQYSVAGIYNSRGYRILVLNIHPVSYIPNIGEISYFKDIKIRINLVDSPEANSLYRGIKKDEDHVIKLVDTPQMINTYTQKSTLSNSPNLVSSSNSFQTLTNGDVLGDPGPYDYVIITNVPLRDSPSDPPNIYNFQDLADYKNLHGIQTTIVTVEEIYAYYNDDYLKVKYDDDFYIDNQVRIREFIKDAYKNWEIEYVLLGGDGDRPGNIPNNNIIPTRGFYCLAGSNKDYNIVSDLYYAGLDGTWNTDEDDRWGEPGEDDLFAEVYVGRAPVGLSSFTVPAGEELSNFIRKTLAHEASLTLDDPYLYNVLMLGQDLWPAPGDGGDHMDEIIPLIPERYNVYTLYDRDYWWSPSELISKINDGVHIINHLGHAYAEGVMKLSVYPYFWGDNDPFENEKYFLGYSQGCLAGGFDLESDCISECFIISEHGAFAFIGNSRIGFIGPGNSFHQGFIDAIFKEGIMEIGKANQDSKEDCIWYISSDYISQFYRWVYYTLNLLGDPTTTLYIDTDGDGMPDNWEIFYGLDPNDPADAKIDLDGDKLINLQEFQKGTNPNSAADIDKDGMPDDWETYYGINDIVWNQDFDDEAINSIPEDWIYEKPIGNFKGRLSFTDEPD